MSKSEEANMFPAKWAKVLKDLPEFKENAESSSVDDLKKIVLSCEGNLYNIEKEKSLDVKLNGAKELVKEYTAPYRDAMKVQTAKIKYALFLLENKGEEVGGNTEE
jgi:hypothetical protein